MEIYEESEVAEFDYRIFEFGSLLKYFRGRQGVSQEVLGDAIGRRRNAIGQWEKGKSRPRERNDVVNMALELELGPRDMDLFLTRAGFDAEYSHYAIPSGVGQYPSEPNSANRPNAQTENIFGYLVIRNGPSADTVFALRGSQMTIGRHPGQCDLVLSIRYDLVSRTHAAILKNAEGVFVKDMGSQNGTYIDRFTTVTEPTAIEEGQHLLLGGRQAEPGVCDLEFLLDIGSTAKAHP